MVAFGHIVLAFRLCFALLSGGGATGAQFIAFMILSLALVAAETLNTAITCITDHLSLNWQVFAQGAKESGDLKPMCTLTANSLLIGTVLLRHFEIF
ncbi:diacylglycerol kinase [Roseovarius sp. M141]|uniref:diacylglycerol kinase n=1 Tax=Roseovarius sp. M141 TaxID=2583806 RepID=UPI0020CD9D4A